LSIKRSVVDAHSQTTVLLFREQYRRTVRAMCRLDPTRIEEGFNLIFEFLQLYCI
jgi:hypothetical protein